MFATPAQHQVRARASHHPSKYRSKRRPGRVYRYGQAQPKAPSLDLGNTPWPEARGARNEFVGYRPTTTMKFVFTFRDCSPKQSVEKPQDQDGRSHTAFMSFDGTGDEALSPLAKDALGGRARMLVQYPSNDERGELLPKGRTCFISDQDISDQTVEVSGIKSGKEFDFWMNASDLKMEPETEENTVGFACVVIKENFCIPGTARNPRREKLWIYPGDEGVIKKVDDPMWLAQVVIPDRKDSYGNTVTGWFVLDCLRVGTAKYGDVDVRFSIDIPPATFSTLGMPTTSQFPMTKYFFDLFTGILEQSGTLGLFESFIRDMGDPSNRYLISHEIANGLDRAGLTRVLADPDFTMDDIEGYCVDVHVGMIGSGGIYARRYSKFTKASKYHKSKHDGEDVYILYVGKASKFGPRMGKYNSDPFNQNNKAYHTVHSRTIREAGERDMLVLVDLDPALANFDRILTYAEQGMMCFLQSWRKKLVAEEDQLPENTDSSNVMQTAAVMGLVKSDVLIVHRISVAAAQNNNLPGGVLRDGFGILDGLNYNLPILETRLYEGQVWVVLNAGDRLIYTRGAVQTTPEKAFSLRYTGHDGGVKFLTVSLSKELQKQIPPKTKLYASWERMKNGVAHPIPYFRMPEINALEGADEINSLGIKITWRIGNQWKQKYAQMQKAPVLENATTGRGEGGLSGVGFMMLNYFKQQVFLNRPAWMPVGQIARLVYLKMDHLSQTITADYRSRPVARVPAPRLKSIDELTDEMEALGLENVDEAPGFHIPKLAHESKRGRARRLCDNCFCSSQGAQDKYMPKALADVRSL
jgi:hypothetical protein